MGVAMSEQRRTRQPHPDEVSDLGVHRRGEPGRERRDHLVGLVMASLDRQRPARLDVDQDVGTGRRDPELHERHARHADLASVVAQQFHRNVGGQPPVVINSRPRGGQSGRPREAQPDVAVRCHFDPPDLRAGTDERPRCGAARDVDAHGALAGVDGS